MLMLRLQPRDPGEESRAATALELMFDLATVIAVAKAAAGLAQAVGAGHFEQGVSQFACAFFMAWLAWVNYTWFASAYDNDSPAFRAWSLVIMFGSLTLAGGIQNVFNDQSIWLALLGLLFDDVAIAFSMWGLYFDRNKQLTLTGLHWVMAWAYGHYVLFAAGAATAAGFAVLLATTAGDAAISQRGAVLAIAIPIALYLAALWFVRDSAFVMDGKRWLPLLTAALIILAGAYSPYGLEAIAAILSVAALAHRRFSIDRRDA